MSEYPFTLEEIVSWFESKESVMKSFGITLANVRRSHTNKPAATGNFDTDVAVGQICFWVSGEIDFQVLRVSDGKDVFLHHEIVSNFNANSLKRACDEFTRSMTHPDYINPARA
jgi:hypothetical protein